MGFIWALAGLICLVIFGRPLSVNILNPGNALGLFVGCLLILYGIFRSKLSEKLRRILGILGLTGLVLTVVAGFFILRQSRQQPQEAGTLIVLGCGVKGESPSLMLRLRIEAAADYLKEHPDMPVVCSGGQGPGENISEALCIARELKARGIAEERIYLEDRSTSTSENLSFSLEVIRQEGLSESLLVVSNDFHLYRAGHMARRLGLSVQTLSAPSPGYLYPTFFMRECLAVYKEWIIPDPL